jgi:hypothetical protein
VRTAIFMTATEARSLAQFDAFLASLLSASSSLTMLLLNFLPFKAIIVIVIHIPCPLSPRRRLREPRAESERVPPDIAGPAHTR